MISKTYLRYIWLLDTISKARFPLTYEDIVNIWMKSPYAYMGGLPIRTFHEHRKGIEEMFGVTIACDKSTFCTYYIKNPDVLKQNHYAELLLRKYSSQAYNNIIHLFLYYEHFSVAFPSFA